MARRTLLSILLTPTLVVLFGVAAVSAVNAGPQPVGGQPPGPPWPGTPICAEGTLGQTGWIDPNTVALAGSIQPCAGTDPAAVATARWGVAEYHTQGAFARQNGIRRFASASEPTAFTVGITLAGLADATWGPLRAVCVITGPKVRVACLEFTTEWNGNLLIEPIPVSDPRVNFRVTLVPNLGPDPECGACA
jgi:hypothetical protein